MRAGAIRGVCRGSSERSFQESVAVLREFENGIWGVAGAVGSVRDLQLSGFAGNANSCKRYSARNISCQRPLSTREATRIAHACKSL